jgi:uncharacterized membrane protein
MHEKSPQDAATHLERGLSSLNLIHPQVQYFVHEGQSGYPHMSHLHFQLEVGNSVRVGTMISKISLNFCVLLTFPK